MAGGSKLGSVLSAHILECSQHRGLRFDDPSAFVNV